MAYFFPSVHCEVKPGQEPKQMPKNNAADWFALQGLLSCLSYITQDNLPGVALLTVGWPSLSH